VALDAGPRVVTVGDNVVDCYPDLGLMFPGGNMVNVAVHLSRLGTPAAYVGAVGTDPAGDVVREALAAEGVDLSLLRVVPGPNAWAGVRIVDGDREFVGGDAGVSAFRLTEADDRRLARADVVHSGVCSFLEDQLPRLRAAARRLSFDFSERPWEYVETYAPAVDVAVLSLPEAEAGAAEALARRVQALGPAVVAVTLGAAGALLLAGGRATSAAATPVEVVDTLGAGDAFVARLLAGLVRDEHPPLLLADAVAYAGSTCGAHGAFGHPAALPSPAPPAPAQLSPSHPTSPVQEQT
jgi:sugar/nucleoside kinase (ribokinase family)